MVSQRALPEADMVPRKSDLAKEVESEILDALGAISEPFGPRELINKLSAEKHLNDTLIREAIWQLIDLKRIRLTDDMKLEVAI